MKFPNRREAGRLLARKLLRYAHRPDVIVLALPRGGMPVAYEVAVNLGLPVDVFLVRKLGLPGHEELAMGAVASGGVRVLNEEVVRYYRVSDEALDEVARRELREMARREAAYRSGRPPPDLEGKVALVVDDGLATGSTMRAAVAALRSSGPSEIVVAVPVAPPSTLEELRGEADEVICLMSPEPFLAVGLWYEEFGQTSDDEVRALLSQASEGASAAEEAPPPL